ncbi:uncharacterized protein LOC134851521 [Symsagittifera roscoffensis]|uniref:uncharacterized protein LOC134851521 n=1 Tax=Symsagittifera roscoffensis TaxID=84072 RepID=UPI00307C4C77
MDDDFDDLLDLIEETKPEQSKIPENVEQTNTEESAPPPKIITPSDSKDLEDIKPLVLEDKQQPKPASAIGGKRKAFKIEKEIDWGDDNPTDLLTEQSAKTASQSNEQKSGSSGFNMNNLLGIDDSTDVAVKRPPTGERRPDPKSSLKPTLKVTDEDDNESLAGRGYQPSLGGSSRGRRAINAGVSAQGSVKFGGESILDGESVASGRKGSKPALNASKDFDAMSDILGLSSEPKSAGFGSWLKEENRTSASNDWVNLAKNRRASTGQGPERPKTTSGFPSGTSTPKPGDSGLDLRPKTSTNEPLFGDEIPLDQLLSSKPPAGTRVNQRDGFQDPVTPAAKSAAEHSETPKTEMATRETLQIPAASGLFRDRSRVPSEDGLSIVSGAGSQASRDTILDGGGDVNLRSREERTPGTSLPSARSQDDLFGGRGTSSGATRKRQTNANQNLAQLFDGDSAIQPESMPRQQPGPNFAASMDSAGQPQLQNQGTSRHQAHAYHTNQMAMNNANIMWEEEKNHLVQKYEQKMKHLKELHEDEVSRSKDEKEALSKHYKSLIEIMEKDRVEVIARYDRNSQDMELRHQQSLESLRLLQEKNFQESKSEFEKKVEFVKKQKEMEVEAIKSASSHLQSVNVVVEQVESQAKLINEISTNLGNKSANTLDAREFQIRAKENEIRIQEERLERQLADTERERKKIQELITKMEMHMRETASTLENDKFNLIQDQARLAAEKKNLQMQQQQQLDKISQERSWLDKAKADFEREQKENRSMLYEERRLLGIERAKLEASVKSYSEREKHESVKTAQAEAEISGSLRAIANEHETLAKTAAQLKMDRDNLEKERNAFDQEKKRIEVERKIADESKFEIRSRQSQLDHLTADATKIRDEGLNALSKATAIELEHNHRTQQLKTQLTSLRAQEQSLAQERLLLAQEQKNLETKKNSLICSKCSGPVSSAELNPFPSHLAFKQFGTQSSADFDNHFRHSGMHGMNDSMAMGPHVNDSGFNTPADFTAQINSVQQVEIMKQMLQMDYDLENLRNSAQSEDQYLMEEEQYIQSLRASRNEEFPTSSTPANNW